MTTDSSSSVADSGARFRNSPMTVPVHRPRLPVAERLLPYLRRIDEARWYTNFGPLVTEFEERVAGLFGVPASAVATQANGTQSLTVGLRALGAAPRSLCLMPSWTFVASAAAVMAADLIPYFVDVDKSSWTLSPDRVLAKAGELENVGAVMVVSAFGAPLDTAVWDRFTETTRIPVLIDAAASFDSIAMTAASPLGSTPQMLSLHATKSFGIGEGGLLMSGDDTFMLRARRIANFGFESERMSVSRGINAKLSEYAAAVGLAALDAWPETRRQWSERTAAYVHRLRDIPGVVLSPGYGEGWVSSYCNIEASGGAEQTGAQLARAGIATRRWWGPGCHAQTAYREFAKGALPVTEELAELVLGLPFSVDISDAEIDHVVETLRTVSERDAPDR
jgi:dTDP-4-amino-4,6-dideoxygalactose transaminase